MDDNPVPRDGEGQEPFQASLSQAEECLFHRGGMLLWFRMSLWFEMSFWFGMSSWFRVSSWLRLFEVVMVVRNVIVVWNVIVACYVTLACHLYAPTPGGPYRGFGISSNKISLSSMTPSNTKQATGRRIKRYNTQTVARRCRDGSKRYQG